MISYIKGKISQKEEGYVVIESNGIGYEIQVSDHTSNAIMFMGEEIKLLTYLQVREDGFSLYGFISKEEKDMFLKLITVSGIGPKMAIGILSSITVSELSNAIFRQDVKLLCTVKGLGKKTAERVLVELKDKVEPVQENNEQVNINQSYVDDATEALVSLGVGRNEAYRLAKENAKSCSSVEEIITKVLRGMG